MSSLESAAKILADNNFPIVDLPGDPNSVLWQEIRTEYDLTLAQFSALKNYARISCKVM
jgi:hypothetical protein